MDGAVMRSALDGTNPVVLKDKLDNPNGVTIINDLVSWQRSSGHWLTCGYYIDTRGRYFGQHIF